MSFRLIGLGKLLRVLFASNAHRVRLIRTDIRAEVAREARPEDSDGGDFYVPFWADAKSYVAGGPALRSATEQRVERNLRRARLYPRLANGFLLWWDENRRQRNEPFTLIDQSVRGRYATEDLGTVKVENTLAFTVENDGHRIVYPYFCEDPVLGEDAARLGLWVMSQAIRQYGLEDMRLLDVLRGRTFSTLDTPLRGDEEANFQSRYAQLLSEWDRLREEY